MIMVKFRMVPPDNSMKTHPAMPRRTHQADIMLGKKRIGYVSLATNGVYHYELYRDDGSLAMFQGTRFKHEIDLAIFYTLGLIEDPYAWQ
jgi:hypothetical protein